MLNAVKLYELSNWCYRHHLTIVAKIVKLVIFLIYNSAIPYECKIGQGSKFAYGGIGIVIHNRAQIGMNVIIGSNVTIGEKSGIYNVPIISDNVYIATGAKIIGAVKIGSYAVIGANAVVIDDVPEYAVVGGVPAKIISYKGKEIYEKSIY